VSHFSSHSIRRIRGEKGISSGWLREQASTSLDGSWEFEERRDRRYAVTRTRSPIGTDLEFLEKNWETIREKRRHTSRLEMRSLQNSRFECGRGGLLLAEVARSKETLDDRSCLCLPCWKIVSMVSSGLGLKEAEMGRIRSSLAAVVEQDLKTDE
jgi:hypothetical protein